MNLATRARDLLGPMMLASSSLTAVGDETSDDGMPSAEGGLPGAAAEERGINVV